MKYLDGNCLAATEHRLQPLRETAAGALPGKSLVVLRPRLGLATDVLSCTDGHARARALLGPVVETVEASDSWIADRTFCVSVFLSAIHFRGASLVFRQHTNLNAKPLSKIRFIRSSSTGRVYEQPVQLTAPDGTVWQLRRVVVKLSKATRDDDTTLGYPQSALFGFCMALVAFNLHAVVMAALRAVHPAHDIDAEVSEDDIAGEIATTFTGLEIAVPDTDWEPFAHASPGKMFTLLFDLAQRVDLRRLPKTPRGPKKLRSPRTKFKGKHHVSTAKLLAGR